MLYPTDRDKQQLRDDLGTHDEKGKPASAFGRGRGSFVKFERRHVQVLTTSRMAFFEDDPSRYMR